MKYSTSKKWAYLALFSFFCQYAMAQHSKIQFFRPYDERGINIFETTKIDTVPFTDLKVRIGGSFTQDFQMLSHQNNAVPVYVNDVNKNQLIGITNAFNLAMANLYVDVQLADGIRLNLTTYLSTRHHEDTWVKGGYIQFDKLPFLKNDMVDAIMKSFTIKVGDFDVDYGDAHYRRTDGGNSIYNPFVENYIMDAFATEIGGEIYFHPLNGPLSNVIVMGGITNGELNPTVVASTTVDSATKKLNTYSPAFHGKIGYDKQLNKDLRVRLTGSFYYVQSANNNTLFFGDRTGSHYFFVMENTAATSDGNAWSGRYNPLFSEEVKTFMINPFIKFKGFEFFGTYELSKGRMISETSLRQATQYAADFIYRFTEKQNFWIAFRYNRVNATMPGDATNVNITREVGSIGWFPTRNIMLKAEYVNQVYGNFPDTDIRSGGKFHGPVIEAAVGF